MRYAPGPDGFGRGRSWACPRFSARQSRCCSGKEAEGQADGEVLPQGGGRPPLKAGPPLSIPGGKGAALEPGVLWPPASCERGGSFIVGDRGKPCAARQNVTGPSRPAQRRGEPRPRPGGSASPRPPASTRGKSRPWPGGLAMSSASRAGAGGSRARGPEGSGITEICASRGIGVGKRYDAASLCRVRRGAISPGTAGQGSRESAFPSSARFPLHGENVFSARRAGDVAVYVPQAAEKGVPPPSAPERRRGTCGADAPFTTRRRPCLFLPLRATLF